VRGKQRKGEKHPPPVKMAIRYSAFRITNSSKLLLLSGFSKMAIAKKK
jgi:hypothetical protein